MSKLTREEAEAELLNSIDQEFDLSVDEAKNTPEVKLLHKIFNQHEDETALLRMENDKLQKRIHEWEKQNDIIATKHKNQVEENKHLRKQLGKPDLTVTACPRGYIEDFEWYGRTEPNATYDVFVIKQKGE